MFVWHNYCKTFLAASVTMAKCNNHIIICIVLLSGLFFLSGCEKQGTKEVGFLEGKISIGPLCPVETDPPNPACMPTDETYKAYPVSIWTSDGKRKIIQLNPSLDGSYNEELEPGNYLVILETGDSKIGSSNLPGKVEITSQNKTIFNIDIDTGIR
jgi:hypothetical protein